MKKTLYMHVGAGKTGTSVLQQFFLANQNALAERGYIFPHQCQVNVNHGVQHHLLADLGSYKNPSAIDAWAEIAVGSRQTAVISSELLHNKISTGEGPTFFRQLRELFADWNIRVVFYIRRQSQWLQSAYAQHVKGALEVRKYPDFVGHYKRNLPDQIIEFSEIFGPKAMVVRPFERAQFVGSDICKDFCTAIDLEWSNEFKIPKINANPRLTLDALELKRQLNHYFDSPKDMKCILDALLDYSKREDSKASADAFHTHDLFDPAIQLKIEQENASKYARIAGELMGRSDGVLFRDGLDARLSGAIAAEQPKYKVPQTDAATAFVIDQLLHRIDGFENRLKQLKAKIK
ncbi:hypothetical protein FDP25_08785 [Roseovarius sp. A21]|uniref:Sulfotransferase family protein n=1 Tax=Roseovarius bejariae TaxID=2576383 RepID=A0A844CLK5_9RHOB|nr:hypothetical protein [Roseovarius bejariae]MRU15522.1 hypothetical protein [Roseovarius bejariae]